MTDAMPFYSTHDGQGGMTEVHVQSGPTSMIIVTMRAELVGTDTGDEIIRRAIEAHAERRSIVHGEES